jgi:3-oxoadipate enol-lactonase
VYVQTNGIRTYCEVTGDGDKPWVVLSHSLACGVEMWQPQIAALAERFRVLNYDVRGHGRSDAPAGEYSLGTLAEDVNALLAGLDIESAHFIGLSMGGMIGQTNVLAPHSRLKSLVLADTTGRWPDETQPMWRERIRSAQVDGMRPFADGALQRWFTPAFHAKRPEMLETVRGWIEATPVPGFIGCCHAIPKIDSLQRLKNVKMPCLIIVGADDPGTPPDMSRKLHDAFPGSELREIPEAAHLCNIERPDVFNKLLADFYTRVI